MEGIGHNEKSNYSPGDFMLYICDGKHCSDDDDDDDYDDFELY